MHLFVATLTHTALHWVSAETRLVLTELSARKGYAGPAHQFALAVGLKNRFQLARLLKRDGLPSLEVLAGWVKILIWVVDHETGGTALSRTALLTIRDPGACYRSVERITGVPWSRVRCLGSTWVLLTLVERCRRPAPSAAALADTPLDASSLARAGSSG